MGINTGPNGGGSSVTSPNANGFLSGGSSASGGGSPFGTVSGPQASYPGAGGVTSYGLFSSPGAGTQVSTGQRAPAPTAPAPPTPGAAPPQVSPVQPHPSAPGLVQQPTPQIPQLRSGFQPHPVMPQGAPSHLPLNIASAFSQPQPGLAGYAPAAHALAPPGVPSGNIAPSNSGTMQAMDTGRNADTNGTALHSVNPDGTRSDGHTGQDTPGQESNPAASAQGSADTLLAQLEQLAKGGGGDIGALLGKLFAGMTGAWDSATGGGSNAPGFANTVAGDLPGWSDSGLTNAVTQNAMSMMDPAAWQQMAQNRLDSANRDNLASLNVAQRRLADMQGRTGMANNGGVLGNMYNQYAQRGIQNERDIFNDTLNNQMNAIGVAGNINQGLRGQDLQRWLALTGLSGQAGMADAGAYREDHPSGAALVQDLLGAAGSAAGGYAQGAMGLMGLLGPLLAGA